MRPRVVLVNLGTPEAPTAAAVRSFLGEFLADPRVVDLPGWLWRPVLRGIVLRRRPARVARLYESIWTEEGSPLAVETHALSRAVRAALPDGVETAVAYRYGRPGLAEAVRRHLDSRDGVLVVVPLFPQPTEATSGTIRSLVADVAEGRGEGRVRVWLPAPDAAGYLEALAARCREGFAALGGIPERVVFSYHGIPLRYDRREGGAYTAACSATTAALAGVLGLEPGRVLQTYQSRFGPERWTGPATQAALEELAASGVRSVAVACPGFLTEGLETLEEIGVQAREAFLSAGGERFALVASPATHPALARELAEGALRASG